MPGKSVPGKSVPGKSVPGKSVPGKSVPGKSVPGKSVPGKRRKRRKGIDEEEDEAATRHLDTTAMTYLGTLAKPDLLEVLQGQL